MAQALFESLLLYVEVRKKMHARKYLNTMFTLDNSTIDQRRDLLFKSITCELSQPWILNQHSVLRSP